MWVIASIRVMRPGITKIEIEKVRRLLYRSKACKLQKLNRILQSLRINITELFAIITTILQLLI